RREPSLELLSKPMNRIGEIANFSWRGQRRVAAPLAGSDRARDITEVADGSRNGPRKQQGKNCRQEKGDQARCNDATSGAREQILDGLRRNGNAGEALRRFHRNVQLLLAGRRAHSKRSSHTVLSRLDYFRSPAVILETLQ